MLKWEFLPRLAALVTPRGRLRCMLPAVSAYAAYLFAQSLVSPAEHFEACRQQFWLTWRTISLNLILFRQLLSGW